MATAVARVDSVLPKLGQSKHVILLLTKKAYGSIEFAKKKWHSRPGTHVFKNAFNFFLTVKEEG